MGSAEDTDVRIDATQPPWVQPLREALQDLRYGSVVIKVHDSHVVEIERRDRLRVVASTRSTAPSARTRIDGEP